MKSFPKPASSSGSPGPPSKKFKLAGGNADSLASSEEYEQLQQARRKLPIWSARKRLLRQLQQCDTSIVIGETGSGKTTQIPQFLYEAGLHNKLVIACTQPRRVAAVTMAQRVAAEKGSRIGELVGHCVRFDDSTSMETRIKYMTDGMLLREAILDPLLKRYGAIILDEAHERTIDTDVLFGIVKAAQKKRKEKCLKMLKIIVMSATMDVDHFSKYFNEAPVLYFEGRQHAVSLMYASEPQSDYLFASMVTVFQLHRKAPAGQDILVFLTGQEEIEAAVRSIRNLASDLPANLPRLHVIPLYAALPPALQLKAFKPAPPGARKVILSTNIAETSVTIHGIKFVVDTGMVKCKSYVARSGLDLLKVQRVSQAQAWQRTGRAGRQAPGTCYRLYTEQEFSAMKSMAVPEILRCNLASVVLQLLAMGIPDVLTFDFMDKPQPDALQMAVDQLQWLGAVNKQGEKLELTSIGQKMVAFPLQPCLAKTVLAGAELGCLEEILTIVSLLSVDTIVYTPANKRDEALAARAKFVSCEADHLTMMAIYHSYKGVAGNKHWCHENFVNLQNMRAALDIRQQLREICVQQELPLKSCQRNHTPIRKSLAAGFFTQAAELQSNGRYIALSSRRPVSIHPSSSLFQSRPAYVIFNELVETSKCYMRDVCMVDADWLYDVAPEYFRRKKHVVPTVSPH